MDWKPINSAPKDETRFLVANKRGVVSLFDKSETMYDKCFWIMSDATHWIPLPPPPDTFA